MNKLTHYFIPHPETHKKAHLLSWHYLIIYILLFVLLKTGIELTYLYKPGVLGVNSNITVQQIIEGTNRERQSRGLPLVKENQALNAAALAKAQNMFEENYWAHFSPSGKDPWGFILKSGYKFTYAGENLAKNFYNANDVVAAWMNSSSHRENLLNSRYHDIGVAVVEGVLQGQTTTLVVQEFGTPYQAVAAVPRQINPVPEINIGGEKITIQPVEAEASKPVLIAGSAIDRQSPVEKALVDPSLIIKGAGIFLLSLIAILLLMDFIILRHRGVFRLSSHHFAHISFIVIIGAAVLISRAGGIL